MISSIFDKNSKFSPLDSLTKETIKGMREYKEELYRKKDFERKERLDHLKTLSVEERLALIEECIYDINQRIGTLDLLIPLR